MIGVVLVWTICSVYFNYLTPQFQLHLSQGLDITMVELVSAAAYGLVLLPAFGIQLAPRVSVVPMLKVGVCHLLACRLFIAAVCGDNAIPVSLAQTIRAANPLFVVMVSYCFFGQAYTVPVLVSLCPILMGFSLATVGELEFNILGFGCAVASVTILVVLSLTSKEAFAVQNLHWSQIQFWSCAVAACLQFPTWAYSGGMGRVASASMNYDFLVLVVVNGGMYYAEQVLMFMAIERFSSLTYSVVDTLRRLVIVVVTGYVLRGDQFGVTKTIGVLIVCAGAVYYNIVKDQVRTKHSKTM